MVLSKASLVDVSPFTDTGQTPDDMFVGREHELRTITEHIRLRSFAIVGGRRIGKTSVLGRLHRIRLPAAGYYTVYHDCSTTPDCDAFLAAPILQWSTEPLKKCNITFGELFKNPPNDRLLVILLDEADKLIPSERSSNWRLFNLLRSLINQSLIRMVICGERSLDSVLQDPASPLFNLASKMLLGPIDYVAVEELVTRPMRQMEIELVNAQTVVDCIFEFTSGHPSVVQRICCRLVERLSEQDARRISLTSVNEVINDPKFQENDFLAVFWERATPLEQIISLLMAQEPRSYRLQDVLDMLARQGLAPEPKTAKAALDRLVDLRSILKRSQTGYSFAVPAFPRVVANTTTSEDLLIVLKSQYLKKPMELPE